MKDMEGLIHQTNPDLSEATERPAGQLTEILLACNANPANSHISAPELSRVLLSSPPSL